MCGLGAFVNSDNIFHDFACQFHALVQINLNESQLRKKRLLCVVNDKIMCDDIPIKYLTVIKKDKWFVDCFFKRMMIATFDIKPWRVNLMRGAVFFNFGWLATYKNKVDMTELYSGINRAEGKPPLY